MKTEDMVSRENNMNIQIYGTNKFFDTKKAMRYLKERNCEKRKTGDGWL